MTATLNASTTHVSVTVNFANGDELELDIGHPVLFADIGDHVATLIRESDEIKPDEAISSLVIVAVFIEQAAS